MRVQHNEQTKMFWVYIPTSVARLLKLNKKDDVEFNMDEKTNKVEFRKINLEIPK